MAIENFTWQKYPYKTQTNEQTSENSNEVNNRYTNNDFNRVILRHALSCCNSSLGGIKKGKNISGYYGACPLGPPAVSPPCSGTVESWDSPL